MKKTLNMTIMILMIFGVVLQLNTLDPIYYGIYDEDSGWVDFGEVVPDRLDYNFTINKDPEIKVYYFYNNGFGVF